MLSPSKPDEAKSAKPQLPPGPDDRKRPLPEVAVFDANTATVDEVTAAMIKAGGCVLKNLASSDKLDLIEKEVRTLISGDKPWDGDFWPAETRRVMGLAGKSKVFTETIVGNKLARDVC